MREGEQRGAVAEPSSPFPRRFPWLPIALAAVLLAAQLAVHGIPVIGTDDANIFLTYGRNLRAGHGWVYTPGHERVEGTTSFFYTLLAAVASGVPRPEPLLALFNVSCFAAALATTLRVLARVRSSDAPGQLDLGAALLFVLWGALHPGLSFWCGLSLLDTALWTFLLVAAAATVLAVGTPGFSTRSSLLAGLLVLTRPEALALVPAFGLVAFALARRRGLEWTSAGQSLLPAAGTFLLVAPALTGFRLLYFGYPLPNTYYAKVGSDWSYNLREGFGYLFTYLRTTPLLAVLLVLAVREMVLGLRAREGADAARDTRAERAALAALALACALVPTVAGGDHFAQGRFLTAATLLLPLPVLAALPRFSWKAPPVPALVTALAGAGALHFAMSALLERTSQDTGRELVVAERGRRLAHALNLGFRPASPTLGAFLVGGMGYEYEGRVLDLLGLNHLAMAHASRQRYGPKNHAGFDRGVFEQVRPEVIPLAFSREGGSPDMSFLRSVTRGMIDEARFRNEYAQVTLARADGRSWLEDPDFFVPPPLQKVWRRSEGGRARYRLLIGFLRRDLLQRTCAGEFRARVLGPGCE